MAAYMTTVVVPASYAAQNAPNIALEFVPDTLIFRSVTGSFYVSFDGVNDHLLVEDSDPALVINTKRTKIWFKQNSGAATARLSAVTTA